MFNQRQENMLMMSGLETSTDNKKHNDYWKFIKWIFSRLAISTVAIILMGGVYQFVATKIDESKYPMPGKLIDVGGYRLHLHCTGEGDRTVILEAGLGGGVLDWSLVQPEIARFTRVCSYDRAGMGWSETSLQPRNAQQIAEELHTLLKNAEIKPPFILVGHSIGGIYTQMYSSLFPDEVAGMVLVDSSHENQLLRKELPSPPAFSSVLVKALAPLGVGRILFPLNKPSENISPDLATKLASIYSHTGHLYSVADELANIPESMQQLRNSALKPGAKPLIVLTRSRSDDEDQAERAWQELQADLANLSTNSKQIIAKNSGHYIHLDEPSLVIFSIYQVMNESK